MKLLTGAAGSGKTRRVLAGFREALSSGQSSRLIVPTTTLAEHLRNELARDGFVFRSNSVLTLAHFLEDLAPSLQTVKAEMLHLMVEDAVMRLDRPEFRKVATLAGFHSRLTATITDLDSAGCTPRQLERVRRDLAPFRDALAAVWSDVERQMRERHRVTRGELLRRVAAGLDSKTLPRRIWIDGFAQLSGPEIELIQALGARADLTLTLPDEGLPDDLKPALIACGFTEEHLTGGREPRRLAIMPEIPERECEEIARRILERARAGAPFREMGVIVRQPEKYEPLLRATFERFRIPAHFYFSRKLETHPAGRLFAGAVEGLLSGWEHEQTLELLRLIPSTGVSDAMDVFEIRVREALPGQGLDTLLDLTHDKSLRYVLRNLARLNAWLHARYRAEEWAERIGRLAGLFRTRTIPDGIMPREAELLRSQAAGASAFADAMREASQWWPASANAIGLAEFWRKARTMVRLSPVAATNRARNLVHVIHAYEARQWDLSAVFVCGLVETEFPAHVFRDPFLQDAALRDLQRQGARVRTTDDKEEEERGLFEAVCARARDQVVLSYPRTDARGQRNLRSIFLKDFEVEPVDVAVRPTLPEPVARWRQQSALRSRDLLDGIAADHATLSVTALESLLQCPFQFFAKRALRIEEMPGRPEDRLSFLLQGAIVHDVLKDWFLDRPPLRPLFDEVFARKCAEKRVPPGYRMERQRRALFLSLERFIADTTYPGGWKSQTEQPFEFPLNATLKVRGKMDRIDELGDGRAVVIDYKFSRAASTRSKVTDPTKLQGPLYALALRRAFGLEAAAMIYISMKEEKLSYAGWGEVPGMNLKTPLAPLTREWMDDAVARVSTAIEEFREGVIHPRPASVEPCRYCDHKDACRFEEPMAIPVSGA